MKTAKEYWRERFGEYPQTDSEKLAVVMMLEYSQEVVKNFNIPDVAGQSEQLICLMDDDKPDCTCEINHCFKKGW